MRKFWIIMAIIAIAALAGCASSGGTSAAAAEDAVELPPAGTERLTLQNGALAIYKFELPAGQTWGNYVSLTAEYLVDDENISKTLRSGAVRLLGNYLETQFEVGARSATVSLSTDQNFAHKILDNNLTTWDAMGAVAGEWFTYEYNITGSRAHGQFNRANIPAADAAGPFFFALGLSSQDEGRRNAITQLIRNITLVHASDPSLNVVTTSSGFDKPASAAYYAANVQRVSNF
ncbi:MAG: hypothetical protein FWB83_10465 [Treponema sp.]|nr:hypothetical protein [Treponema sp.]MCL2181536.1 hypothetical protein [Treponema sp.]